MSKTSMKKKKSPSRQVEQQEWQQPWRPEAIKGFLKHIDHMMPKVFYHRNDSPEKKLDIWNKLWKGQE